MVNAISALIRYLTCDSSVDEPAYNVTLKPSSNGMDYEVRSYGPRVAIVTDRGLDAFGRLADYIGVGGDPQNEGSVEIAMTAPVAIEMTAPVVMSEDGNMMFILPAEYDTLASAPLPLSEEVWLKELPPSQGAVHRYSGPMFPFISRWKSTNLIEELDDALTTKLEGEFDVEWWGYDPPMTFPMCRRNEVYVELTEEQVDELKAVYEDRRMLTL